MHYSVHCVQSLITATHSKGFPAEVANHLANTAGVMPAVADIPYMILTIMTFCIMFHFGVVRNDNW